MTDCRNCRRDTELYLCRICTTELGALLGELPWLFEQLAVTIVRQDKLTTGAIGRSSDNPSPINVGAMELSRNLHTQLGTLIRQLCEAANYPLPERVWTGPAMSRWLYHNLNTIAATDSAGHTYRDIQNATNSILGAINRTSRMYCGPCTTTVGHNPQGEDIECGIDLYADRENPVEIQCPKCRTWIEPRKQLLITITRRDLLPEPKLLETLEILGDKVSRRKLYEWIGANKLRPRGYVHQGRIVEHRIQRGDPRVFSLSQARQLCLKDTEDAECAI